jgi:hypothetical protein
MVHPVQHIVGDERDEEPRHQHHRLGKPRERQQEPARDDDQQQQDEESPPLQVNMAATRLAPRGFHAPAGREDDVVDLRVSADQRGGTARRSRTVAKEAVKHVVRQCADEQTSEQIEHRAASDEDFDGRWRARNAQG